MKKFNIILLAILILASFLRFYNLMHDAPYFFDPDERNMASAVTQFHLPNSPVKIIECISSEFSLPSLVPSAYTLDPNSCTLNPHFFAYGQFPLYLAYVSDQISQQFINITIKPSVNRTKPSTITYQPITSNGLTTSFSSAIYWLRFWSALVSVLTVLMVYKITKFLFPNLKVSIFYCPVPSAYLAALLTAFIPGLIQSAHFGTTESLLTFFFLSSLYFSLKMISDVGFRSNVIPAIRQLAEGIQLFKDGSRVTFAKISVNKPGMTEVINSPRAGEAGKFLILSSLSVGLAIGSKMTGVFFLTSPCLAISFSFLMQRRKTVKDVLFQAVAHLRILAFFFIVTAFFVIIASPYNLIDPSDFLSAVFGYERDVAQGKYEAFYTRQFVHTTPIIFQFEKIFPYSLGIVLTTLGSMGFLILIFVLLKSMMSSLRRQRSMVRNLTQRWIPTYAGMTTVIISFLIYFIPNAFLFAKWSRFMTPTLPFFVIFSVYFMLKIIKKIGLLANWIIGLLVIISTLQGLSFFSIYTRPDSRFTASRWIYKNIPSNTLVLSETANVIDIPIPPPTSFLVASGYTLSPISFDFYHLDENPELQIQLITFLEKADYIFIPSRRIFANYTKEPGKYPVLNKYYENLFNGNLGFEKVAEISSFPSWCLVPIAYCLLPDESSEETFTVFDHPVVRIYKKNQSKTLAEYQKLLL